MEKQTPEEIELAIGFCHSVFRLEELNHIEQTHDLACAQINEIGELTNYIRNHLNKKNQKISIEQGINLCQKVFRKEELDYIGRGGLDFSELKEFHELNTYLDQYKTSPKWKERK